MRPFDALVAAMAAVDSEFQLTRIPFHVFKDGVLDLDARLKALEAVPAAVPANEAHGDAS
jgi:hypothetical protein